MHEYTLMEQVIAAILKNLEPSETAGGGRVTEVAFKIGALDIHSEASFRQAFEILTRGTRLENSTLHLTIVPAALSCSSCGYQGLCPQDAADGHDPLPCAPCPRCGALCAAQGGRGIEDIELTLEEEEGSP
jgi:Zn finger protein HypA/HybF involved in hydrogenase expression